MDYIINPYIEKNSKARAKAKSDLEKDFYKLCNNAIYGKTLQDQMKQMDVKITTDDKKMMKWASLPQFKDAHFANNHYFVQSNKNSIKFNKPIYIGATILDLSKLLMYDFHYNIMSEMYGKNIEMIYTDTDSFVYQIYTDDLYDDMTKMKEYFDFSEMENKMFSEMSGHNKKIPGKFKDETKGKPITEFVALKPKMYSYTVEGSDDKNLKAKGISKNLSKKELNHEKYKEQLEKEEELKLKETRIQIFRRHVYTVKFNKIALSNYDDKMHRIDNYNAYSYGHKNII